MSEVCNPLAFKNSLAECLKSAGQDLSRDDSDVSPLRVVQRFLWDWEDTPNEDVNIRFLVFFMKTFLHKVFYNLTGDVPFVENVTSNIQTQFYKNIGHTFLMLSSYLKEKDYSEFYSCYSRLGIAYLDAVYRLNKEL